MKFFYFLFFSIYIWSMTVAKAAPTNSDIFCGMIKNHFSYEEADVKSGITVASYFPKNIQSGHILQLNFYVAWSPSQILVSKLEIANEKYFHLIGVRNDLEYFFHIHPDEIKSGQWAVSYLFPASGRYKLWSDIKYSDNTYTIGHPFIMVLGKDGVIQNKTRVFESQSSLRGGYTLRVFHTEPLTVGNTNWFRFKLTNSEGRSIGFKPYLGSHVHLSAIRDDLSVKLHGHPIGSSELVSLIFPQDGIYRLFAEVRPETADLKDDTALTGSFWIRVSKEGAVTSQPEGLRDAEIKEKRKEWLTYFFFFLGSFLFVLIGLWARSFFHTSR